MKSKKSPSQIEMAPAEIGSSWRLCPRPHDAYGAICNVQSGIISAGDIVYWKVMCAGEASWAASEEGRG